MTMLNAWQRDGGILFLTDTATLRQSGRVAGFANKVATFPHLNLAVAMRGSAAHVPSLLVALTRADFRTYSEFESGLAGRLKRLPLFRWTGFDLVVAHVPPKKGQPRLWGLSNRPVFGVPAWQRAPLTHVFNEGEEADFTEDATNFATLWDEDDGSCLTWLAATQRIVLRPFGWSRKPIATIGGSVIATTVSAGGIHQREVGRWPDDRLGQPLDPAAVFVPAKSRRPKEKNRSSSILSGGFFG